MRSERLKDGQIYSDCPIFACLPNTVKDHITGKHIDLPKEGKLTGLPLQNTGSFSYNRGRRKIFLNLKRYGLIQGLDNFKKRCYYFYSSLIEAKS